VEARVVAVSSSPGHRFSKAPQMSIRLLAGLGVEGDAHCGATVKHRWQRRQTPEAPNRRQVHLIPSELFAELQLAGFVVAPGDMGENITTGGLDLLALPTGTRLHLGDTALIELTGLRQPCSLLDRFQPGLKTALLERTAEGGWRRKAGVMAVVLAGGEVYPGDAIRVVLPEGALRPLECV